VAASTSNRSAAHCQTLLYRGCDGSFVNVCEKDRCGGFHKRSPELCSINCSARSHNSISSGQANRCTSLGWGSVDQTVEAMWRGASDFIQKPWDNRQLLQELQSQLSRAQAQHRSQSQRNEELRAACEIQDYLLPINKG
jgi:hypothetical protein